MCPVERERDRSGLSSIRSSLTPELPVNMALAGFTVVGSAVASFSGAGSAAASSSGAATDGANRIVFAIYWIALRSFVFTRCGGYIKASDFTHVGHRIAQSAVDASSNVFFTAPESYKRRRLSDGYITMKTRHISIAADTTDQWRGNDFSTGWSRPTFSSWGSGCPVSPQRGPGREYFIPKRHIHSPAHNGLFSSLVVNQ